MKCYQETDNAVCDAEHTLELSRELRLSCEVPKNIVALVFVVDSVSELSLAPLVCCNIRALSADHSSELLDEGLDLLFFLLHAEYDHCFVVFS